MGKNAMNELQISKSNLVCSFQNVFACTEVTGEDSHSFSAADLTDNRDLAGIFLEFDLGDSPGRHAFSPEECEIIPSAQTGVRACA